MAEIEKSSLDNSYEKRKKEKETTTEEIEDKNSTLNEEKSKKLEPIVKRSDVKVEKKGFFEKVAGSFVSESFKDVMSYALYEIVIPGIKDGFFSTLEHMFYGGSSYSSNYRRYDDRKTTKERTNYSSYWKSSLYDDRKSKRSYREEKEEKTDYRRIIVRNERDAINIVGKLRDYINDYGQVSVARLLDLIDEPGKYTDNNWGWTDERDINYRRVRNGYLIDVPEAEYLGD